MVNGRQDSRFAEPLRIMRELRNDHCVGDSMSRGTCEFNGQKFDVLVVYTLGYQESIFDDSLRSASFVIVTNLQTNTKIEFDGDLLPKYIELYGFYEGNTSYRLAPETIISFFAL